MSNKEVEYKNEDITIVWNPSKCTHSGNCVRNLPQVYHPKDRPWVKIENATTEQLKKQLATCPSGALTYYENK